MRYYNSTVMHKTQPRDKKGMLYNGLLKHDSLSSFTQIKIGQVLIANS